MARSWKKFERTGVTLVAIMIWVPSEFRGALQQGTVIVIRNVRPCAKRAKTGAGRVTILGFAYSLEFDEHDLQKKEY
ncbi:MAG: hypothetical protein J4O01_00230 [Chloroflexi bacterium]|nr:hypothetical protein [Chloroflexota bacterium]MCI0835645.1 hypothetical protein [Chloroflexota bacterium]MCI0850463.1 hypothetical protein [Chloroflexota bacterium]